ncbi:MAG: hypothetical protein ACK5MB_02830 [Phycisphaerales bacterium]|jgi:hypothetical protein
MAQRAVLDLGAVGKLKKGLVGKIFNKELGTVLRDVAKRPGVNAARKLTIVMSVTPKSHGDDEGSGESAPTATINVAIRSVVPPQQTEGHECMITETVDRATGERLFAGVIGGDPDNVAQATFGGLEDQSE